MIKTIDEARASKFYDNPKVIDKLEWIDPLMHETFGPVEESFTERPTFVQCVPCGKVHRYRTPGRFQKWAINHGEMCRNRP